MQVGLEQRPNALPNDVHPTIPGATPRSPSLRPHVGAKDILLVLHSSRSRFCQPSPLPPSALRPPRVPIHGRQDGIDAAPPAHLRGHQEARWQGRCGGTRPVGTNLYVWRAGQRRGGGQGPAAAQCQGQEHGGRAHLVPRGERLRLCRCAATTIPLPPCVPCVQTDAVQ